MGTWFRWVPVGMLLCGFTGRPAMDFQAADSSNYTPTNGRTIRYIILHTVEGSKAGAIRWFKNPAANVSAHFVVGHDGSITQMLQVKDIGWHAGNWKMNRESIGIEHEGYARRDTWTEAQIRASARLTAWLCETYGIPKDRNHILGHSEVPGATHTDPGPYFDWDRYMRLVQGRVESEPDPAPAEPAIRAMEVTALALNVRSGPGTGYGIRGQVKRGQVYASIETQGEWRKIWFDGDSGWCWGGYLKEAETAELIKVTASALNVRDGPGIGYDRLGLVFGGQVYHRTGTSGEWSRIQWGGREAWIHSSFLEPIVAKPQSGAGNPGESVPESMEITAGLLNVRSGPGGEYRIIGRIPKGQVYYTKRRTGDWREIWFGGSTGWVHGGYLRRKDGIWFVRVATPVLNVRSGPGVGYAALGVIREGQWYHRVASTGTWIQIEWAGRLGWIHHAYVDSGRS